MKLTTRRTIRATKDLLAGFYANAIASSLVAIFTLTFAFIFALAVAILNYFLINIIDQNKFQ